MEIDKSTPIPLYYQLAERLREQIDDGRLKPGDQLPSERELSEQTGISRMTARQAVTYLVRQGRLDVRPGIGTFVAEPKLTHDTLHLLGFTEEMLRHGRAPISRVLEQATVTPPQAVAAQLKLAPGALTTRIIRLRLSQETPLLLETVYVPEALAPGLPDEDLSTASLYGLLEERYQLVLHHAQQTLEVTTATDDEAELFALPPGSPMLLLEGTTYSAQDEPVEAFKALYRGDKFKFALESQRLAWGSRPGQPRLSVVLRDRH